MNAPNGLDARTFDLLFAPLHKRALGMAVGTAAGLLVFVATAALVITGREQEFPLALLGEYFYGYTVSWEGAVVGLAWGFVAGFATGWFLAFSRNLAMAIWLFVGRARAELAATRDFLDHI